MDTGYVQISFLLMWKLMYLPTLRLPASAFFRLGSDGPLPVSGQSATALPLYVLDDGAVLGVLATAVGAAA